MTGTATSLVRSAPLLALLVLVTACSGDDDPEVAIRTGTAAPPTPVAATATPEVTPTSPSAAADPTVEVLAAELTVFTGPGVNFVALGTLQHGDEVTPIGFREDEDGERWLGLNGLGWVRDEPGSLAALDPAVRLPSLHGFDHRAAAPPHPLTVRSGIPEIDAVIDAVAERDRERLQSLVRITAEPCSTDRDSQERQCPAGVEDGTVLERFDIGVCAGSAGEVSDLPAFVDALFDPVDQGYGPRETDVDEPLFVYAVAEIPDGGRFRDADGPYVIYLVHDPHSQQRRLTVSDEGEITRLSYGCDGTPPAFSLPPEHPPIVPPYAPPPLEALPS